MLLDALSDLPSGLDWVPGTSPAALDLALDTLAHRPPVSGLASDAESAAGRCLVDFLGDWRGSVVLALDKGWSWMTRNHLAGPIQPGMRHNSMLSN